MVATSHRNSWINWSTAARNPGVPSPKVQFFWSEPKNHYTFTIVPWVQKGWSMQGYLRMCLRNDGSLSRLLKTYQDIATLNLELGVRGLTCPEAPAAPWRGNLLVAIIYDNCASAAPWRDGRDGGYYYLLLATYYLITTYYLISTYYIISTYYLLYLLLYLLLTLQEANVTLLDVTPLGSNPCCCHWPLP